LCLGQDRQLLLGDHAQVVCCRNSRSRIEQVRRRSSESLAEPDLGELAKAASGRFEVVNQSRDEEQEHVRRRIIAGASLESIARKVVRNIGLCRGNIGLASSPAKSIEGVHASRSVQALRSTPIGVDVHADDALLIDIRRDAVERSVHVERQGPLLLEHQTKCHAGAVHVWG
jgi:hypothetical protein